MTERSALSDTGTIRNHVPVGQAYNDNFSDNQEITVLIDNNLPDVAKDHSITR